MIDNTAQFQIGDRVLCKKWSMQASALVFPEAPFSVDDVGNIAGLVKEFTTYDHKGIEFTIRQYNVRLANGEQTLVEEWALKRLPDV